VIDHLGINCAGYATSREFYDVVLGVLGFSRQTSFWIYEGAETGIEPNREVHIAFAAADEAGVRAFHAAAVGLGAESLHASRLWPEYHPGYFGAFVRDPDGNNVEAVWHGGQ
jgi:catechol 2,3-dioxygenase-like lactoylglutathione lyase family enzyme